ncbi:hypothetical protein SCANM63S_00782 [Streptomyces canarius]
MTYCGRGARAELYRGRAVDRDGAERGGEEHVPSGSTDYDYRDVFFSTALGSVTVDGSAPVKLGTGASATVTGQVTAAAQAPAGREFFGRVQLVNARGTVAGSGSVKIEKVTP